MPQKREHSLKLFYFLIASSALVLIYGIFSYSTSVFAEEKKEEPRIAAPESNEIIKENLIAKSYIIYDINNKTIIRSKDPLVPLPLASLTKVITISTLLDAAKKNKIEIQPDTKLSIKKALVSSSNDDAEWLGVIFQGSFGKDLVTEANNFLHNMGIDDTHLTSLTGLDNYDGTASNTGSPESIAKVFAFMYENFRDVFEYTKFDHVETEVGTLQNTNKISEKTFGMMASKTGFTWEAGGNLGVIVSPEPGSAYVILVLNSTKEGRFEDVAKLSKLLPIILKN